MIERHLGTVVAVAADSRHHFSKPLRGGIDLVQGLGVEGDAHAAHTFAIDTWPDVDRAFPTFAKFI